GYFLFENDSIATIRLPKVIIKIMLSKTVIHSTLFLIKLPTKTSSFLFRHIMINCRDFEKHSFYFLNHLIQLYPYSFNNTCYKCISHKKHSHTVLNFFYFSIDSFLILSPVRWKVL